MTYTQCLEALYALAPGKYVCLQVETSRHTNSGAKTRWKTYVDGCAYTRECETPEEVLEATRVMLGIGADTDPSQVDVDEMVSS